MFGTGLLFAFALLDLYVLGRLAVLPAVTRRFRRSVPLGIAVLLFVLFVLARSVGHTGASRAARLLELGGMDALVVLFLMAVALLGVDLTTGFGRWWPRQVPWLRLGAVAVGLGLSVVAIVQGTRAPVVSDYEVRLPGLPASLDGTRLVAVSDLHVGPQLDVRWLDARVAQVQALHPDIVVLLGDLVEGQSQPSAEVKAALGKLSAPLGVYAVTGNHERAGRSGGNLDAIIPASITLLRDRALGVCPGLVLGGVDDLGSRRRGPEPPDAIVARVLGGRPEGATILLTHTPLGVEAAARAGAGLVLAGHTHGGQIWPFSSVESLVYRYFVGRYDLEGTTVLVCRGTGTWGPRMRLWQPGEIMRVTLRTP